MNVSTKQSLTGNVFKGVGYDGKSAYELARANGFEGTEQEWLEALKGSSAYELAVKGGFEGTEAEWLESLRGKDGKDGVDGKDGAVGPQGEPGKDGVDGEDGYTPVKGVDYFDGKDGVDGAPGKDGYTPVKGVDYFDGLPGENGKDGKDGKDGAPGKDGADGEDGLPGEPGFSPVVSLSKLGKVTTFKVTDKNGMQTVQILDGADGEGGGSSSGPAIIDVVELPTENIQEDKFYRLLSGRYVYNRDVQISFHVYCVETLPESGIPVTDAEQSETHSYYNISDGEVYGYIDDMLSMGTGVPVGWYPAATLFGAFDLPYSGIITDIEDDPYDDSFRFLISKDFYVYDSEWAKIIFAYERSPKFEITWDGVIGDKFALDMSPLGYEGIQFVKVSDDVLTETDIMGATYYQRNGYEWTIDYIDSSAYPGALNIDGCIIVVYSADNTNAALGLPTGYITNGTYFVYSTVDEVANYTYRFVGPNKVTKIDGKYITLPTIYAEDVLGLSVVATTGNYHSLTNIPKALCYDAYYGLNDTERKNVRRTIDVYSKSEVDNKITNVNPSVDLSAYATKEYVDSLIGSAIGGSY